MFMSNFNNTRLINTDNVINYLLTESSDTDEYLVLAETRSTLNNIEVIYKGDSIIKRNEYWEKLKRFLNIRHI